jgi:hypothetical protein
MADFFVRGEDKVAMFDLGNAEYYIREKLKEKIVSENGVESEVMNEVINFFQPDGWEDFGPDCPSHATSGRRWLAHSLQKWQVNAQAESVPGFDDYESVLPDNAFLFDGEEAMHESFGALLEAKNSNPNQSEVIPNV